MVERHKEHGAGDDNSLFPVVFQKLVEFFYFAVYIVRHRYFLMFD
jgi:hypothetical protein